MISVQCSYGTLKLGSRTFCSGSPGWFRFSRRPKRTWTSMAGRWCEQQRPDWGKHSSEQHSWPATTIRSRLVCMVGLASCWKKRKSTSNSTIRSFVFRCKTNVRLDRTKMLSQNVFLYVPPQKQSNLSVLERISEYQNLKNSGGSTFLYSYGCCKHGSFAMCTRNWSWNWNA